MTQRLTYHLESTNSLNDRQHGFREGKSVDTAINETLSKIKTARRDGKHVLVLSFDIKGAFDNLQHRAILKSLDASACPVNINRLFHSLLQNIKVTLLTPQGRATKDQKYGCPQEETFFYSKAIPTPYIGSLSHHHNGSVTNYTRHPTLTHAITVRSQVFINFAPKNPSSPYHYRYPTARSGDEGNRLVHYPSEHLKPNQISFEDKEAYIARKDILNIFTDGSKTEHGVGFDFCVLTNDIWAYQWSSKLNDNNTVFQTELTALHEAVICASHLPNHNTSKIHVDNRESIMLSSNSKSTNETARKIFKILLTNPRIKVSWVKAHAGNIRNERADQFAKDVTQHGQPVSHTKLPKPHINGLLRKRMLEEWQTSWKNGVTGRKIYNILPSVSLCPTNWIREDVIFFSQHGPFPAYLKRFHLSDSDYCSCGGIGKALHYATDFIYTVYWHMRKPAPNFEQEWLKRVANNLVSRQKIRGIIKFISENRDLFRPP
ncbi:hypothetical protein AVEN_196888-1 [Araneus ventricosus]|uniref:RNase H type-1 domain-containing protein n=1 Tax=Araneus ventricosus TaxID=182803 RepID=A0A4Y2EF97_ARAVE|nr:hypothetical protein AVEN_196888-1 [Araneus ventricosus]